MHKIEKLDKPAKKLFKSDLCIPTYDSVMHKIMEVNNMEKCVNIVKKLMKEKHIEKDHKIIVVKKKKKSKQTNSHKTSRDSLIKVIYFKKFTIISVYLIIFLILSTK